MLNSEKENTSPVPPIGEEQDFLADAKRRLTLEVPNKISRRKSVENLVISSHDAIGQSISHALSFSGAITQQASQHSSSEHRSVSRSPSPCRRPVATPILEHGDYLGQTLEVGGNSNSARGVSDALPSSQGSSPPPSLSLSTPLPEQPPLPPLNRSSSQEVHPRNPSASLNPPLPNSAAGQPTSKSQESRTKKKSWYSALYPTYKSRSEDFKKIFKDVPDDERLIVDYSCAIQKDILVHGRLYVSQNYLCFYANIFRWETFLSLRWKDVTAITKEKTAIVIPNAILICTETEKHFLTSFAGRDKTYMMLFRIWQNALMDQPMSSQEMWQWVHLCYGEELGFNSDDEEYPQNYLDEDKLTSMRLSAESISEDFLEHAMEGAGIGGVSDDNLPLPLVSASGNFNGGDTLPTDMSDSSQSDVDKPISFGHDLHGLECTDPHEGRKLMSMDIHVHIDQLFTMLFTNSKFYVEFLALRKTTDLVQNVWNHDSETGLKTRKVSFTILLNQSVGPKSAQVTETQMMLSCTRPGCLYSIEITSCNAGIPYADSFVVMVHYCLQKVSENVTNIQAFGQIKYKKSVWTVIKTFIEKNCWAGLEDYFDCLTKSIIAEIEEDHVTSKRKSRRRRRGMGVQREGGADLESALGAVQHRPAMGLRHRSPGGGVPGSVAHNRTGPSTRLLWAVLAALSLLLVVNVALYWKLWGIEGTRWLFETEDRYSANVIGTESGPTPELIAEWSQLLKEQSSFHMGELDRWRKALNDAISLLKQTETALGNLQSIIKPSLEKLHPPTSHPNTEL